MKLRRSRTNRSFGLAALFALSWAVVIGGCERDDTVRVDRNRPPETFVTQGPEVSADPARPTQIFYQAHLYWRGEDADGTIQGFRFAVDDTSDPGAWGWTTSTDSVFRFQAGEVGAKEHLFLIRAVDNLGKQDASPDTLRFESFTSAQPQVWYDTTRIVVENDSGVQVGLGTQDTVLVNSLVTLVWTGFDADGEVLSWESVFRNQVVEHARDDTSRTIGPLNSNRHEFTVRAVDDAGAKSTSGGFIAIKANFDPKTTIQRESIISTVARSWISGPDSILITQHYPSGGTAMDTIPFGASLRMAWDSVDPDGPVVTYTWRLGGELSGETVRKRLNTDSLIVCEIVGDSLFCDTTSLPLGMDQRNVNAIIVRGRDIYGQVEGIPTPVNMFYNLRPSVVIDSSVTSFPAGQLQKIWFAGSDTDSDPGDLQYSNKVDGGQESEPEDYDADSTFVELIFQANEIGTHRLIVTAFDQSGFDRPSVPDTLFLSVVPPTEPRRRPSERGQMP